MTITYQLFVTRRNTATKDSAHDKQSLASRLNQHFARGCDSVYVIESASGITKQVKLVDGKPAWEEIPEPLAKIIRFHF